MMSRFLLVKDEKEKVEKPIVPTDGKSTRPLGFKLATMVPLKNLKGVGSNSGSFPPAVRVNAVIKRQTLRFETTAAVAGVNGIITAGDIFGALGVVGKVSNTSVVALATSFRLKRVTIWPSASTSGGVVASMSWASDDDHDPDIDWGVYRPAGLVGTPNSFTSTPPPKSLAGFWQRDTVAVTNVALFYVAISATGSVLDLDVEWTLPSGVASSQTITATTAVVGTFYRMYLNRVAGANTLKPVNYPATI
jgi:hypothetical protein